MKKRLALFMIMGMLVGVCSACGSGKTAEPQSIESDETVFTGEGLNEAKVIRIGVQPGSSVAEINRSEKVIEEYLEKYGVEAEFEEFTYGPPIIESLASGNIDITIGIGNLPVFTGTSNGTELVIAYNSPAYENGLNGIVVKKDSGIKTVEDLIGKKIGVPVGSAAHSFLSVLMEENGHSLDDVTLVNVAAADMATSLANGEVDAGVLWETVISKTKVAIDGEVIIGSKDYQADQGLLVASKKFAEENPEILSVAIAAVIQINQEIVDDPEGAIEIIAAQTGDAPEAWESLKGLETLDAFTEEDYETAEGLKKFLLDNDLIQQDFDERSLYTNVYWEEAKRLLEAEGEKK